MKQSKTKKIAIVFGLVILAGVISYNLLLSEEFKDQENAVSNCPSKVFDKSAKIFDSLLICGTNGVPDDKLKHAAQVAAEWLDNDSDGQADEPAVVKTMKDNKALVVMSSEGISILGGLKIMGAAIGDGFSTQDLSAEETNNPTRRDASQEEIHHIVMNAGWMKLHPEIFSDQTDSGSRLYKLWKFADDNGHYYYGDPTCNDVCKVSEFVYLATAAYLGSDVDVESDEMRLKTREALAQTVPEIIDIFESTDYAYPTNHWPRGQYPYARNIVYSGL